MPEGGCRMADGLELPDPSGARHPACRRQYNRNRPPKAQGKNPEGFGRRAGTLPGARGRVTVGVADEGAGRGGRPSSLRPPPERSP
jgi:hypothetical protein